MKKVFCLLLAAILLIGCFAGCQKDTTTVTPTEPPSPDVTTSPPAPTKPDATQPAKKPEPIKPQGNMINNMVLRVIVGTQAEQVVENPNASFIYNYILNQRKDAKEEFPSGTGEDYLNSIIELSFWVGEKCAAHVYFYEDNYVGISIDANSENAACRFYKFPDGAYSSLLATLEQK